jgi:hypothetical protein
LKICVTQGYCCGKLEAGWAEKRRCEDLRRSPKLKPLLARGEPAGETQRLGRWRSADLKSAIRQIENLRYPVTLAARWGQRYNFRDSVRLQTAGQSANMGNLPGMSVPMRKSFGFLRFAAAAFFLGVSLVASTEERDWPKERQFWSFQAPKRHPLPAVSNRAWPAQPLDYFILASLEAKGLSPSGPAGRQALIRRLSLDLTGLPPTPGEVELFLTDESPDAYDRLAERLLNSRAFGERMASLWLPLARYAEDQAHQVGDDTKFFYPNAFKYREWVIDSFNHDLPYDRFLKYQLAADDFEEAGRENLAALGFLGLGPKYYNRNRIEVMADEWEDRVDTVTRAMLGLTVACARCHDHKFEPITMQDYYGLAGVFASTRMVNRRPDGEEEKREANADKMSAATLHMVDDGAITNLHVFIRGNPERKGDLAERRFLRILSEGEPDSFESGSGRKDLAEKIASPQNPLTARVLVNRVWGAFFGKPIVATPSNFGHSGQLPSHPELLDDLAARFMANDWSVKALVREIVLSSAYRQSAASASSAGAQKDPENLLLWRMNRKRLTIEQWRDSALFVAGELNNKGGKSLELDDPRNFRRTVYARISRLKLNDTLMQFDYPDANVHAERRTATTTPTQKLFLLNNPFVLARAATFQARLTGKSDSAKLHEAYQILFGRAPSQTEEYKALEFLSGPAEAEFSRWEQLAQVLLASNEFLYVD